MLTLNLRKEKFEKGIQTKLFQNLPVEHKFKGTVLKDV